VRRAASDQRSDQDRQHRPAWQPTAVSLAGQKTNAVAKPLATENCVQFDLSGGFSVQTPSWVFRLFRNGQVPA
jgi:hypothetical protein